MASAIALRASDPWSSPNPACYPLPRVAPPAPSTMDDVRAFAAACAGGDPTARRTFLERFAEDVYNFPTRIYGVPAEHAADFYLYAFERDRIFTRLRSFEGRNAIQLRTFLAYYVLRALFLDWQRGRHELDTVSLDSEPGPEGGLPLGERLASTAADDPKPAGAATGAMAEVWAGLAPEERLDLKLLSLLEHDLDADDLRLLSKLARRPLDETRALVGEVQAALRSKDVQVAALSGTLDSVWGWLVLRRRELHDVDRQLSDLRDQSAAIAAGLRERRAALEASIAKRDQQRDRLLRQIGGFKVTTPYKDIARLKGSTVGTVCSRLFRLRERLAARWPNAEDRP